jgi:hypothetical protein
MGNQDAKEKKRSRYADEREKKINEFPGARLVKGPDGAEIDKEAVTQAEKQTQSFKHGRIVSEAVKAVKLLARFCRAATGLSGLFI